jgi:hypothetical protein
MLYIVLMLIITFNYIILGCEAIKFQATDTNRIDKEFYKSLEPYSSKDSIQSSTSSALPDQRSEDSSSGYTRTIIREPTFSSQNQNNQPVVSVNKYILLHNISDDYKSDVVSLLVQVTNIGDKDLDDIDIFETASRNFKITNCSIPTKSSSITEIMRYLRGGTFFLCSDDISQPRELANKLAGDEYHFCINSSHIKSILNNNSATNESIKRIVVEEMNDFIENSEFDFRKKSINENYLYAQTKKLIKLSNNTKLQKIDRKLLNFFLLRDIYTSHIKKPDNSIEINEKYGIDELINEIDIHVPRMHPKESIMYVFFGNVTGHEMQRTTTIVGIPSEKISIIQFPLDVTLPSPKFSVSGDISEQEVKPGDPIKINYIVELLNPLNESHFSFKAKIINGNENIKIIPDENWRLEFINGSNSCNFTAVMIADKPGSYNIPSLTVDDNEYFVLDKYIKVEPRWHTYILEITIMFLGFCTLIGGNLPIFAKNLFYRALLFLLFVIVSFITIYLCEWLTWSYIILLSIIVLIIIVIYLYTQRETLRIDYRNVKL